MDEHGPQAGEPGYDDHEAKMDEIGRDCNRIETYLFNESLPAHVRRNHLRQTRDFHFATDDDMDNDRVKKRAKQVPWEGHEVVLLETRDEHGNIVDRGND